MYYRKRTSKITGARAWTEDDTELYTDLTEEEQKTVLNWIRRNVEPRCTVNMRHTSYGMKHILERDTKIYMTNNQFKDAMLECGYFPEDMEQLNWNYRISEKSPCFTGIGGTYGERGTTEWDTEA